MDLETFVRGIERAVEAAPPRALYLRVNTVDLHRCQALVDDWRARPARLVVDVKASNHVKPGCAMVWQTGADNEMVAFGEVPQVTRCKSCHAPVWFAYTGSGKRIPVDPEPTADGNLFLVGGGDGSAPVVAAVAKSRQPPAGAPLYTSHFATCPQAASHRRAR